MGCTCTVNGLQFVTPCPWCSLCYQQRRSLASTNVPLFYFLYKIGAHAYALLLSQILTVLTRIWFVFSLIVPNASSVCSSTITRLQLILILALVLPKMAAKIPIWPLQAPNYAPNCSYRLSRRMNWRSQHPSGVTKFCFRGECSRTCLRFIIRQCN